MRKQVYLFAASLCCCAGSLRGLAAVTPVISPLQLDHPVTINFDGYASYTAANTLFEGLGVTFTRDDGAPIYILNWTALDRTTTSPDNVLATVRRIPPDPTWATHLNVLPCVPVFAMGAYFGNDQGDADFTTIRLSAFGFSGDLLGSVEVAANQNTQVDQFIGLESDTPISRLRFENLSAAGTASASYSVVIDDLVFVQVPEPSVLALSGLGFLAMASALRRQKR